MLQSLELENFKAFGERARIPFAPITLIFGENSAGKSTILQALNLLKQTRESREAWFPLHPRTENGIVDLGGFQEMIFDHELKHTLSIRVETTMSNREMLRLPYRESKVAIEFSFKQSSDQSDILLEQVGIYDVKSLECIAKFQPLDRAEIPSEFWRRIGFSRDLRELPLSKLTAVKCVELTDEPEYWKPEFEWCEGNKEEVLNLLKERLNDLEHSGEEFPEDSNRLQEELNSLSDSIEFLSSDFDLATYISKRRREEMDTVLGMQGFLPVGNGSGKRNSWIAALRPSVLYRSKIFDIAQLTMTVSRALERTLEDLFPMGPFRRPPERWYIFRGTSPQDVGYQGDLLPDLLFRRHDMVKETNEWLKRLEIGYKLKVESVGKNSGDLFEVRLIDTRRKGRVNADRVNVALPDVGFGISQLLPFIVQSLVSEKRIISIEQPEVHVHPRLQADLGDLLAEAIKEPRQNQFIIETHSEHLILRLQRLIFEKRIQPEDVSVIYVSRGPEGAKAERLRLDEEGDFIDEWPDGFFPERLRELR